MLKRSDSFAIFWGGGLGDVLALRPLLMALETALDTAPLFFTTASHLQGLLTDLGLRAQLHVLPLRPAVALAAIRGLGLRFDHLYLGPYPRLKTRMLAYAVAPGRSWSTRHRDVSPFIAEQVVADVEAMGLAAPAGIRAPYGGPWRYPARVSADPRRSYLVLHPGAKDRWETTRWPEECWTQLMRELLPVTRHDLVLVGMPAERGRLESLISSLNDSERSRLRIETALGLPGLAALLDAATGVVCHNSGILHLSAMLGRPTLALTGSSAEFWRPPYAHVHNLSSGACGLACNQYRCPVPFYRARCIRQLQVEEVLAAVKQDLLGLS